MKEGDRRIVCLMGPTAAGKTAAAMAVADQLPVALVSVDSAQVYRNMDIGTGKPDAATLASYPHALIDIREPEQPYSAAQFATDARGAVEAAWAADKIPLLVGGTGLYYRALLQGLAKMPAADPTLRAQLEESARRDGWRHMHTRLAALDPASAARLHPNDSQRIQRALEVCILTGRPLSELTIQETDGLAVPTLKLVVTPAGRADLHARIEERFREMLTQGLVEEVLALRKRRGLSLALPSMRSVGYRQTWECLDGEFEYEELWERGVIATRQLARRQLTWLRAESDTVWFDSLESSHVDSILRTISGFLSSTGR